MLDGQAPVETFDELDSTILEARRRAGRGDYGPAWLIARRQTAGRGRRGRAWESYEGNLHATYLFETAVEPGEIALLSFAVGIAIAETLEACGASGAVALKWPNDVMVDAAKIAGVLIDSGASGPARTWAALAFGVNLAVAPKALDQPTCSLAERTPRGAATLRPVDFFLQLRPRLEAWAQRLSIEGFASLREAWLARAYGLGAQVRVAHGAETLEGVAKGLSLRGELELDTAAGRRLIAAGDVFFPKAA